MKTTRQKRLSLLSETYRYSLVYNTHVKDGPNDHPLLTPAIRLRLPLDCTPERLRQMPLTATGQSSQHACLWWAKLVRTPLPSIFYDAVTEGQGRYYLFFYFPDLPPASKFGLVEVRVPLFQLTVLEINRKTPRPPDLWPLLSRQLEELTLPTASRS
ncbi:hypothetical protein [Spirosoma koreense]